MKTKQIVKTKQINKTKKPKKLQTKKDNETKLNVDVSNKSKNGYEWGLGIEHEFIPVIPIKNFNEYKHIYSVINNKQLDENDSNVRNLEKEMAKISNTFYLNIPVFYSDNYLSEHFPFSNMEWTGSKGFWMLETKNMNYKNVSLDTLLAELRKNTTAILDDYNKTLSEHFKEKSKQQIELPRFDEPNEGSIFYLYNQVINGNYWNNPKPKVLYDPEQPTHIAIDTAGSYHFWITLPHRVNDNHQALHQRAAYLLQSIEPLLIATYCSPDPRITTRNKKYLFAGSFRGAVNRFANYGTSLLQDFESPLIFNRQMSIKDITMPGQVNSEHYIFQIRKRYSDNRTQKKSNSKDTIYNDELIRQKPTIKPKYMFLDDNLEKHNFFHRPFFYRYDDGADADKLKRVSIGLNIRRTEGVKGFEFRIMDHLPEHMLKNLSKVIYLVACMSYEISSDDLLLAATNKGWNTMIASSLFDGYKAKPESGYITFLENQFGLDLHSARQPKNTIELLELLVDKCWEKVMKNKKNGIWLILGDDKTKPKIESKNKEILDKLL